MNTQRSAISSFRVATATLALVTLIAPLSLSAATITWGGSSGEYTTGANWNGGNLPNTGGGDTAHITAGAVIYTAGPDLFLNNGGTLRISGGSWTQVSGPSWIQMSGGHILVDGGVFNQGTAGNLVRTATSTITVTAGTANLSGNYVYQTSGGSLAISGTGTVNVAGEFKPVDTYTMSGGSLSANLISFADGPGSIIFTGGLISVNGAAFSSGIYGGSPTKGLNFSTGSTGSLFISSFTLGQLTSSGFLTNGTIQYNGAADAAQFTLTEANGGVYVGLTASAIPEPSSFAALAGAAILGLAATRRRRAS